MSKKLYRLGFILAVSAALATLSSAALAFDPGINQPGVWGGTAGVGAPGAGVRDPGINQPGAMGNVGRDPGFNQPGVAGNVGGVARRSVRR
jgi:hypothetical protein